MSFGTVLTWVERKQAAVMSDRIGANRAYIRIPFTQYKMIWLGLFHGIADGLKMLLKEDWKPNSYDWYAYAVAPWVVFTPVLLVFAVIPFGGMLDPAKLFAAFPAVAAWFGDRTYPMQIARLDAGLLIVFAFGGMSIIGAMLAGWSSSNKFSMLGALRAGSQMISYELVMGLTVLGLILIYGTRRPHRRSSSSSRPRCSASCPPGGSSSSRSPRRCSSPPRSPRTSASRSTCRRPSRSSSPASTPSTAR